MEAVLDGAAGGRGEDELVRRVRSRPEGSDCVDAAYDVTGAVGGIGLADVGQGCGVVKDLQGLLELGQVIGTEDDRRRAAVTGDGDSSC